LQSGCGVDHITDRQSFLGSAADNDNSVAGIDGRTGQQVQTVATVEFVKALEYGQPRPNCAFGIVTVRDGGAEYGHNGVTGELLQRASVLLDPSLGIGVIEAEGIPHVFGIREFRARSEADEIDEEYRDKFPLFATGRVGVKRSAAAAAESRVSLVLCRAARAQEKISHEAQASRR
jgi:hypothetical protein